jgi:hypothetical protein
MQLKTSAFEGEATVRIYSSHNVFIPNRLVGYTRLSPYTVRAAVWLPGDGERLPILLAGRKGAALIEREHGAFEREETMTRFLQELQGQRVHVCGHERELSLDERSLPHVKACPHPEELTVLEMRIDVRTDSRYWFASKPYAPPHTADFMRYDQYMASRNSFKSEPRS